MSSSKHQTHRLTAGLALMATLSALLTSCAEAPPGARAAAAKTANPTYDPKPATPLSQYQAVLKEEGEQIALSPHAGGQLSEAQKAALQTLVAKAVSLNDGAFIVRIARSDPENADATATAQAAADQLRALGVSSDRISFGKYGAPQVGGPVQVSYSAFAALGPDCKKGWDDLSATGENRVTRHFGCAMAANLAAMIADPRDLQRPATEISADATRRITVLNKYRKGEATSSSKDDQASGAVSQAVK